MTSKIIETRWYPEKRLIITHISGDIGKSDIKQWEDSLKGTLDQIEDNSTFKIFVNMYGFKAMNIEVHKRFRSVIPLTLANYGWKVGYVDLFEEESKTMKYTNSRGVRCVGAAHTHQDETKMDLYETSFSSEREHFFVNPTKARLWIENLKIID